MNSEKNIKVALLQKKDDTKLLKVDISKPSTSGTKIPDLPSAYLTTTPPTTPLTPRNQNTTSKMPVRFPNPSPTLQLTNIFKAYNSIFNAEASPQLIGSSHSPPLPFHPPFPIPSYQPPISPFQPSNKHPQAISPSSPSAHAREAQPTHSPPPRSPRTKVQTQNPNPTMRSTKCCPYSAPTRFFGTSRSRGLLIGC
jgi:hypothetical protein